MLIRYRDFAEKKGEISEFPKLNFSSILILIFCTHSNNKRFMSSTQTISLLDKLIIHTKEILERPVTRNEKLFAVCELLADEVPTFDWVGFYLVADDAENELVLGPFVGEATDHTRIPFGTGICGQVALSHETFVSQDVHAEDNYLACSIHVQSEIVVPIMADGEFVAQLDIDSNTKNSITEEQTEALEKICKMLSAEFK